MMGKKVNQISKLVVVIAISLAILISACSPSKTSPGPLEVESKVKPDLPPSTGEPWQTKWEQVLNSARKEGKVAILTNISAQTRGDLTINFRKKFGLELEFVVAGRGAELTQRILTERRAGLFTPDVIITGSTTLILLMKPEGILDLMEPLLILPEVLDSRVWQGGSPFKDKDRKVIDLIAYFSRHLTRNTTQVKEGEIKSYYDLLDPKWKGKVVLNDPTIPGAGNAWVGFLWSVWGSDKTTEYLNQFVKQEPQLNRDRRLQTEWVARGKYPLSIGSDAGSLFEFMSAGAPMAYVSVKEGTKSSSGGGSVSIPSGRPHPNASSIFLNWLLSQEGMTVFSKAFGQPSSRLDVPMVSMPGYFPPEPGEAVFTETEEDILIRSTIIKVAQEIFAPLLK